MVESHTLVLVPETGIEPVRPLLTKAADFKNNVGTATLVFMRVCAGHRKMRNKMCNAHVGSFPNFF